MQIYLHDQINNPSHPPYSEDVVGWNAAHKTFWVIDGATPVGKNLICGKTSPHSDAHWYANALSEEFQKLDRATTAGHFSPLFLNLAAQFTALTHTNPSMLAGRNIPCAAGIFGQLHEDVLYLFRLGDCGYTIRTPNMFKHNLGHPADDHETKSNIQRRLQAQKNGRDFSLSDKETVKAYQSERDINNMFGNARVFSLDDGCLKHMTVEKIPVESESEIILMSDGLARLYEVFNHINPLDIHETAFETNGLDILLQNLRLLESTRTVERIKKNDDAAAIVLTIK